MVVLVVVTVNDGDALEVTALVAMVTMVMMTMTTHMR